MVGLRMRPRMKGKMAISSLGNVSSSAYGLSVLGWQVRILLTVVSPLPSTVTGVSTTLNTYWVKFCVILLPPISFFHFDFFSYFLLKDNCFTDFCCFLSSLNMNQPSVQFSSVTQLCPTFCDPMNRSTPGLPVHHQLPEFTQTHVHQVSDAIQPSHPLSSPSPPAPKPSQHQGLFQWVNSSHEVAKVLEF